MLKLSFQQTPAEEVLRAAATVMYEAVRRKGFPVQRLHEVAEQPRYGFTASATSEPVGPKLVRITDLQDGKITWETVPHCECERPEPYLLQDNDILFARTGATTGKTHLVRSAELAVFASYLIRVRPRPGVSPDYLYYFFQSEAYWSQITAFKQGSAQPNVNGSILSELSIPVADSALQGAIVNFLRVVRQRQDGVQIELPSLPAEFQNEWRIVARIEALAAKIAEARGLRGQASVDLETLISQSAAALLSECGPSIRLVELTSQITDGTHQTPRYTDDGHMFLSAQNVKPFRFMPEVHRRVSDEDYRLCAARVMPRRGDILMARVGAGIGEAAVVDRDLDCAFYVSLALVRPIPERILPSFLAHWLNSSAGREMSRSNTLGKGHSQGNLNLKLIREFLIPTPPVNEQRQIVNRLDALRSGGEKAKAIQTAAATELGALLPSMLDRAFKGDL